MLRRAACLGKFQVHFKLNYWSFLKDQPLLDSLEMLGFSGFASVQSSLPQPCAGPENPWEPGPHRRQQTRTAQPAIQRGPVQTRGLGTQAVNVWGLGFEI